MVIVIDDLEGFGIGVFDDVFQKVNGKEIFGKATGNNLKTDSIGTIHFGSPNINIFFILTVDIIKNFKSDRVGLRDGIGGIKNVTFVFGIDTVNGLKGADLGTLDDLGGEIGIGLVGGKT